MKPFIFLGLGIILSAGAMMLAYEQDTKNLRAENKALKQELRSFKEEVVFWKQQHTWLKQAIEVQTQPVTISMPGPLPTNVSVRILFITNSIPAQ